MSMERIAFLAVNHPNMTLEEIDELDSQLPEGFSVVARIEVLGASEQSNWAVQRISEYLDFLNRDGDAEIRLAPHKLGE